MPEPWDPFPMPRRGEPLDVPLYLGVGRVIHQWECVEFGLSEIHCALRGDLQFSSMGDYGRGGNIFRERISGLARTAEAYFHRVPHQAAEGDLDRLISEVVGFSDRRNEVAHSIVMDVQSVRYFQAIMPEAARGVPQFLAMPPIYHHRRMTDEGLPAFAYSTVELQRLCDAIFVIEASIDDYINRWWPGALPA